MELKLVAQRALNLMDLTLLNDDDTDERVKILCHQAKTARENTAAICIYPRFIPLAGNKQIGFDLVNACKEIYLAKGVLLKVIIEAGELKQPDLIRQAAEIAIVAGADFIKTSTGKVTINATLENVEIMFQVIRDMGVANQVGCKVAGGVRTVEEAAQYLALADRIMGKAWVDIRHFRFGASSLLSSLLNTLGCQIDNFSDHY